MRNTRGIERDDWATFVARERKAAKMSQQALATLVGVARETVWRWETGKQKPESVELVEKVAAVLKVDPRLALAAAGLLASDEEPPALPARDPRLHDLDPDDVVVQKIMALDIDEDDRDTMLNRHRQNLRHDRERYLAQLAEDEKLFKRRRQVPPPGRETGEGMASPA
jgi:transcriptional regulator with XRE-family HTH domain